jgi:hypothetical protein
MGNFAIYHMEQACRPESKAWEITRETKIGTSDAAVPAACVIDQNHGSFSIRKG